MPGARRSMRSLTGSADGSCCSCSTTASTCCRPPAGSSQRLIEASPTLTVLATSREPLGVRGERIHSVSTLDPDAEAVELFVDRARAADDSFALDAPTATSSRRSAAARRNAAGDRARRGAYPLDHPGGAARPARRPLTAASQGDRTAPDRHQTLQATIAWSYQLLTDDERLLFDRLAVFASGFDRAETQWCARSEISTRSTSTTTWAPWSTSRCSLPTAARHGPAIDCWKRCANSHPPDSPNEDRTRPTLPPRHAQHYLAWPEPTRERTFGPDQQAAIVDIGGAWPNIGIAVLSRSPVVRDHVRDHSSAATVYLAIRFAKLEHREWVQRTIIAGEERSIETPTGALAAAANWAWIEGDPARTLRHAAIGLASPDARTGGSPTFVRRHLDLLRTSRDRNTRRPLP